MLLTSSCVLRVQSGLSPSYDLSDPPPSWIIGVADRITSITVSAPVTSKYLRRNVADASCVRRGVTYIF